MTGEEAQVKNFDILHFVADNAGVSTFEAIEKAYNMGVSEQKAVLDKIRAEIMDFEEELFHRPNTDYSDYAAVRHCVEIIDKYKAEVEPQESEE